MLVLLCSSDWLQPVASVSLPYWRVRDHNLASVERVAVRHPCRARGNLRDSSISAGVQSGLRRLSAANGGRTDRSPCASASKPLDCCPFGEGKKESSPLHSLAAVRRDFATVCPVSVRAVESRVFSVLHERETELHTVTQTVWQRFSASARHTFLLSPLFLWPYIWMRIAVL